MKIEKFSVLKDYNDKPRRTWYFRVRSGNGKIVAQSEGYKSKAARDKTVSRLAKARFRVTEGKEEAR